MAKKKKANRPDKADLIDELFDSGRLEEVKVLLHTELGTDENNHWLLTKLSSVYYESKDYKTALMYSTIANKLMPHCPLVLWDFGAALMMTNNTMNALACYRRILQLGYQQLNGRRIDVDPCWEGKSFTVSIITDSLLRIGHCYVDKKNFELASVFLLSFIRQSSKWSKGCLFDLDDGVEVLKTMPKLANIDDAVAAIVETLSRLDVVREA